MIEAATLTLYLLGWNGLHLPNPHVTPGATRQVSKEEVCRAGTSQAARHATLAIKQEVCARYGARDCPGPKWEVDDLISLELGGANIVTNMWPQPIAEARLKDTVENFLHRAVCHGFMELHEAQEGIRTDWTQQYRIMKGETE